MITSFNDLDHSDAPNNWLWLYSNEKLLRIRSKLLDRIGTLSDQIAAHPSSLQLRVWRMYTEKLYDRVMDEIETRIYVTQDRAELMKATNDVVWYGL